MSFGRKKWGKDLLKILWLYTRARIADHYLNEMTPRLLKQLSLQQQFTTVLHRLNGVKDDVKKYLLQLLAVNPNRWQITGKFLGLVHIFGFGVLTDEKHRLFKQVIGIDIVGTGLAGTTKKEQIGRRLIEPGDLLKNLMNDFTARVVFGEIISEDGTEDEAGA